MSNTNSDDCDESAKSSLQEGERLQKGERFIVSVRERELATMAVPFYAVTVLIKGIGATIVDKYSEMSKDFAAWYKESGWRLEEIGIKFGPLTITFGKESNADSGKGIPTPPDTTPPEVRPAFKDAPTTPAEPRQGSGDDYIELTDEQLAALTNLIRANDGLRKAGLKVYRLTIVKSSTDTIPNPLAPSQSPLVTPDRA